MYFINSGEVREEFPVETSVEMVNIPAIAILNIAITE